ncbi:MAG: universal stress protein [Thermoleophilia bacterium]|nr:universal stress protein [Thermoleophilia bacterium]
MPGHITACVDASAAARRALAEAVRLRDATGASLTVLHVATAPALVGFSRWGPERQTFFEDARRWLDALAAGVEGPCEPVLLWGHPAHAACGWAAGRGVDLLVAASHSGRVHRAVLGSFAGYVAHHAPCDVLLVPPAAGPPPPPAAPAPAEDLTAAVDEEGDLFAEGTWPVRPGEGWSAAHLLLAALAREAVDALLAAGRAAGHEAWGRATAGAERRAGRLAAVRIGVQAEIDPPPGDAELRDLVARAVATSAVARALDPAPAVTWQVNGVLVAPPG